MTSALDAERAFAPLALERWFASQPRAWACDLSPSGAMPLTLDGLLSLASPWEREEFAGSSLGYGPGDGSDALRSLIARRYAEVRAGDVVVTCGAIEALHLAITALATPGDEIVVQRPMYGAAAGIARAVGARVVAWDLREEDAYGADIASLGRLLTPATRVVAITQPNNPTGSALGQRELEALMDALDRIGAWLISDEVYRDLAIVPGRAAPTAAGYPRAIAIGDVAKPFGLGGLRIGWLVTRDAGVRDRIRSRRDYTTLSAPTLSDALARIAVRHASELLAKPVANARANLKALAALADRERALSFVPPVAGLTAFVRASEAAALSRRLAAAGILVVPGELFECPGYLRIWLGGPPAEFADALGYLEQLLNTTASTSPPT